jgi:hypothetical protein
MTRRETLGLLCALPLLGLPLRGFCKTRPATVALKWEWDPGSGGPIEYFEVFVTSGDVVASERNSVVTRVGGNLRACEVSLPDDGAHVYTARVRATNSQGCSALSAPVLISL